MLTNNRYPQFDTLEILLEREFEFRTYKPLNPVKTGNHIPDFSFSKDFGRWNQFVNGSETRGPVFVNQLINKPLVIAFYSQQWGHVGTEHLINLNAIQHEVKALGGNLIVISPEKADTLSKLVWDHNLTLNFYFDLDNEIAQKFGVYDEQNPIWNHFTGIDVNIPLLSAYVINPAKQITFHHIDWDFEGSFNREDVLLAVYDAGLYKNNLKSA